MVKSLVVVMAALATLLCGCNLNIESPTCLVLEQKEVVIMHNFHKLYQGKEKQAMDKIQKQVDGMLDNCRYGLNYDPFAGCRARREFIYRKSTEMISDIAKSMSNGSAQILSDIANSMSNRSALDMSDIAKSMSNE